MSDFDTSRKKLIFKSTEKIILQRKFVRIIQLITWVSFIILALSYFSYILTSKTENINYININYLKVAIKLSFIEIVVYYLHIMFLAYLGKLDWRSVLWFLWLKYDSLDEELKNNLKIKKYKLSKYTKLSIVRIFANKLETTKIYSAYFLLITTAAYSILGILWNQFEINIYFILGGLIYASLLYLNTLLVNFRIKKGFYGGNEFEAREIINFIEENSENIDFRDGNTPKKLFNEEDLKEIEEEIRIELNNGLPQPNI